MISLPSFPNDEDFAERIEELIELDGYYYGLALSFVNGERKKCDIDAFLSLKERLLKYKNLENDSNTYNEAELYIYSLEKIVNLLK